MRELARADRLLATKLFIEHHSPAEVAEFLVNLQDAVHGLSKNLEQYQAAYIEALKGKARDTAAEQQDSQMSTAGGSR